MTVDGDKVTVALDAELVARTRERLSAANESDAAVVERALNAYLLGRVLDVAQSDSGLPADAADRLAADEVRAARERSSAA